MHTSILNTALQACHDFFLLVGRENNARIGTVGLPIIAIRPERDRRTYGFSAHLPPF
jgi:hypothetical protein